LEAPQFAESGPPHMHTQLF